MPSTLHLGLFLLMFLISPLPAQESAIAMNNAQQGLADTSWPKKPGNQISPLSGKMKDVKQIGQKEYATGKEFKNGRLYEEREESSMASVPMWAKSSSPSVRVAHPAGTEVKTSAFHKGRAPRYRENKTSSRRSLPKRRHPTGLPEPVAPFKARMAQGRCIRDA
jgi:hypothetical protein